MRQRLLLWLYDLLYLLFLVVASPYFIVRLVRDGALRRSLGGRFGRGPSRPGGEPAIWIHGVSVGEIKAARSLVEGLRLRRPDLALAVSSTTPAGLKLAESTLTEHFVFQFPLDLSFVVRRVLRRVRPSMILLMELEIWPNLLQQARAAKIPVIVLNGRISARSFRGYRWIHGLLPELRKVDLFAVQNEEYAGRLRELGIDASRIAVTGNMKYDNLPTAGSPELIARVRAEIGLKEDEVVLLAGSTHPGEEEIALSVLAELESEFPGLRLVLVPRHVERGSEVVRCIERHGREPGVLTRLRTGTACSPRAILLVDTIGELEAFYGIADVVFVGGSLVPIGGHNILEPAAMGRPVLFGPHMDNFRDEARVLLSKEGAVQVKDRAELLVQMRNILRQRACAVRMGERAREAVASVRGSTERNLQLVLSRLEERTAKESSSSDGKTHAVHL